MISRTLSRRTGLALTIACAATAGTAALPNTHDAGLLSRAEAASSCRHARIGGATKCLKTGQFCARAKRRAYRRYGFRCAPGSDGRYRLRKS